MAMNTSSDQHGKVRLERRGSAKFFPQELAQRLKLILLQGQVAFRGVGVERFAAGWRQVHRGEDALGIAIERLQPQLFGAAVLAVIIDTVALVTFGLAAGNPVGDLIAGAFELFDVREGLGQERLVAVGLLPVFGQGLERQSQRPGSQVGHACFAQDQKAAVEHHQAQPLGLLLWGPADPFFPVGQLPGGRSPIQQRHPLAVVFDGLKQLASGRHVAQIVFAFEQLARLLVFVWFQRPNLETLQK
jgi:hypothetical protein